MRGEPVSWTDDVPVVSTVRTDDYGDRYIGVRTGPDSQRILYVALKLACNDGWADGEGAMRHYVDLAIERCDEGPIR